ncbi:MAG: FAD-binding oxidoreductase [Ardenticatenales bacterium]|nr:FAD-binding oxidoreductase [Ardenticatenales bacterium]
MADKSLDKKSGKLDNTVYDHRWGFADSRMVLQEDGSVLMTGARYALSGTEMPGLMPFAEEILDIKVDPKNMKPERENKPVHPPHINEPFLAALKANFAESKYTLDDRQRRIHSHGQTTADEVYKVLYGELERYADLVFFLEEEEDAVKLIKLADEHDVCLVPYGGGTSVSCALKLPVHEKRMIVMVNTLRLNKILWIDRENFRACVQAGITGSDLEEALAVEGFISGHEPDSMELSTLGGWIATNASGMKKNRYGNIEDIVENVTMVTPNGVIEQQVSMPRISVGMRPQNILFGSEGNLGLITKAVIRIHKLPDVTRYGSIVFPDFETGVKFLYELAQTGVFPASIRLLDNVQFRFGSALKPKPTTSDKIMSEIQKLVVVNLKGFDPHELCAATVLMEGTKDEVAFQEKTVYKIAKKYRGMAGGEGNGKRGYMLTYAIAYIRDFFAEYNIIGETYETTVPWSKVMDVCNAVAVEVDRQHKAFGLPGKPYISPRVTQLYHTGVCIYFTHGFSTLGVEHPDEIFAKIEKSLRQTILDAGGSISHHHGVGKLRSDFMEQTLSDASIEMIKSIKQANDPKNIFGIRNNVFAENGN